MDSATINGLLSASTPEIQSSPRFPRSNQVSSICIPITSSSSASSASPTSPTPSSGSGSNRVQMRPPRPKLSSRPISLPPERLLNARNAAEAARAQPRDAAIEEAYEEEPQQPGQQQVQQQVQQRSGLKLRSGTAHYRSTYIDTQTLRRKWDREYKRYDMTARTAMIVAKLPGQDTNAGGDAVSAVGIAAPTPAISTPNISLSSSVPSLMRFPERMAASASSNWQGRGALRREGNVSEYNPVPTAFRAPRTLQPPPGTFYKPPAVGRAKSLTEISIKPSGPAATANSVGDDDEDDDDEEEEVLEIEVSVDGPCPEAESQNQEPNSPSQSPSTSPEELNQSEAKPVYQRLRSRRLQEFEHREAHFV